MILPQPEPVGVPRGEVADVQSDPGESGNLSRPPLREEPFGDPALIEEVKQKQSDLESKQDALSVELQQIWEDWDQAQEATSEAAIGCANAKMLDLLNRRNYIRNLVRDVNELLEA